MAPKNKKQTMSLGAFLGDSNLGSWADEMEDQPVNSYSGGRSTYGNSRTYDSPSTGERISGGAYEGYAQREQLPLPSKPPYTAHLGNLSFDVTSGDINDFFADCEVTSVRIVEDKIDRKPKGFGYVEFGSLEGLKKALELSGVSFQGRNVRVSVAEPPKDRQEAREITDWTRRGPLTGPDPSRAGARDGPRGYESERGGSRRGRFGDEAGDGKVRDFGSWERKGPLSPSVPEPTGMGARRESGGVGREGREPRTFERRASPSWGEGTNRSQDGGSRPPRGPPPERTPTAAEMDNQRRARMKPDAPSPAATPDVSTPSSPQAAAPQPATRPRLNLAKRTVSEAPTDNSAASGDSKSSPFGAAKPINTQQREQEIEEKRLALRQKQDEERKARDEKKAADKATRTAQEGAGTAAGAGAGAASGAGAARGGPRERREPKDKENGATSPTAQPPKFEILRRMADDEEDQGTEQGQPDEDANGQIVGDKSVTPKQIVRDPATGTTTDETTGETLAEDGWETVPKAGGRKNKGSARALAS